MWMMPLHLHVNQKSDYDYDVAHPIHVSNSHTKFGWISSNGLGGDSVTDGRTDGQTDGRTDGQRQLQYPLRFFKKAWG